MTPSKTSAVQAARDSHDLVRQAIVRRPVIDRLCDKVDQITTQKGKSSE